jgi:hypothetical protein
VPDDGSGGGSRVRLGRGSGHVVDARDLSRFVPNSLQY